MSKMKPTRKMHFRRRREGRTDYKARLKLLKSEMPRMVVRKSIKYIRVQIIDFDNIGDKTLVAVGSNALAEMGWKFSCANTPAAYLTGLLAGNAAKAKKIKEAVLDIGLHPSVKGSKIYAVVKGAIDAGLDVACDKSMFPSEERIKGEHIAKNDEKSKDITKEFEKIKGKILGEGR
jgi:large subunit ribosomal protein L18